MKNLHPLPDMVFAGNIPNWDMNALCHRNCPLCGNDNVNFLIKRPDKLDVQICPKCNMIYLADVPTKKNINQFYKKYGKFKNYKNSKLSLYQRLSGFNNPYINILEKTGGIRNMKVCDIGCSHGKFLELIKFYGGLPFGIEIDDEARKSLDIKQIPNSSDLNADNIYDVISLIQVLEHIITPQKMIEQIAKVLKTDGRLLISIPNGGEFHEIGPSWIGFRVDFEHLNYFSLKTLNALLLQSNFYIEHFWFHNQPYIQRATASSDKRSLLSRLNGKIRNTFISDVLCKGSFVLTVIARKV